MSITKYASQTAQPTIYRNAMEALVVEEVERQMCRITARQAEYINQAEVIAYALNRLPSLYATSEKGWNQQRLRGKNELDKQITMAVRQGLVAVQRDPLRLATPLQFPEEMEPQQVLQDLREILGTDALSWKNLVQVVKRALANAANDAANLPKVEYYDWRDQRYRY
jgi:hypothetical protein